MQYISQTEEDLATNVITLQHCFRKARSTPSSLVKLLNEALPIAIENEIDFVLFTNTILTSLARGYAQTSIIEHLSRKFTKKIPQDLPIVMEHSGTTPLTGEHAQATLRGRPRGRLGTAGSGKGCLRGRPRGRLGRGGLAPTPLRGRPGRLGSTQAAGATLYRTSSWIVQP